MAAIVSARKDPSLFALPPSLQFPQTPPKNYMQIIKEVDEYVRRITPGLYRSLDALKTLQHTLEERSKTRSHSTEELVIFRDHAQQNSEKHKKVANQIDQVREYLTSADLFIGRVITQRETDRNALGKAQKAKSQVGYINNEISKHIETRSSLLDKKVIIQDLSLKFRTGLADCARSLHQLSSIIESIPQEREIEAIAPEAPPEAATETAPAELLQTALLEEALDTILEEALDTIPVQDEIIEGSPTTEIEQESSVEPIDATPSPDLVDPIDARKIGAPASPLETEAQPDEWEIVPRPPATSGWSSWWPFPTPQ